VSILLTKNYDSVLTVHANNVIHGDLTGVSLTFSTVSGVSRCYPQANILIHADGTACLADFGLSLMYTEDVDISSAAWTSKFHGNYPWLAPELIGGDNEPLVRPSKYSDIYSFGGIMLQVRE
jgi:serine/threonine protein kinase